MEFVRARSWAVVGGWQVRLLDDFVGGEVVDSMQSRMKVRRTRLGRSRFCRARLSRRCSSSTRSSRSRQVKVARDRLGQNKVVQDKAAILAEGFIMRASAHNVTV